MTDETVPSEISVNAHSLHAQHAAAVVNGSHFFVASEIRMIANVRTLDVIESMGKAVVTGASGGLGEIYAHRLASRGYDLLLIARRGKKLDEIATQLREKYSIQVQTLCADLSKHKDLHRVAGEIAQDSRITLLVNNAGSSKLAYVADTSDEQRDAMVGVNIVALTVLSQVALKQFRKRDHGILINIGSVLAAYTLPISAIYSGTKAYVMSFTFGLQCELMSDNIFIQLVMPASTSTDIWENSGFPLSQLDPSSIMTPEHCVDAALAGLDLREKVTLTSLEDQKFFDALQTARHALFDASQTGVPASRYGIQ